MKFKLTEQQKIKIAKCEKYSHLKIPIDDIVNNYKLPITELTYKYNVSRITIQKWIAILGLVIEQKCKNPNCHNIFIGRNKYCSNECYIENKKITNNGRDLKARNDKYNNKIKNQTKLEKELLNTYGINIDNGIIREEVKKTEAIEIIEVSC